MNTRSSILKFSVVGLVLIFGFFFLQKTFRNPLENSLPVTTTMAPRPPMNPAPDASGPTPIPSDEFQKNFSKLDRTQQIKEDPFAADAPVNQNLSSAVTQIKYDIATYALQRFLQDKGFKLHAPIAFTDFAIGELDGQTTTFETVSNSLGQDLVVAVQSGPFTPHQLTEKIATSKGLELTTPRPLGGGFFSLQSEGLSILYYEGKTATNESILVAWIQRTPHSPTDAQTFKSDFR